MLAGLVNPTEATNPVSGAPPVEAFGFPFNKISEEDGFGIANELF